MKRLLFLIILLPLLLSVTTVQATERTEGGITIVETITQDMPLMGLVSSNAICKTQSHRLSFQVDGVEKAWTKITLTNACWSVCLSLGNATRSHGAVSGWSWTWGNYLLGPRACKSAGIYRWTYDWLDTPYPYGYMAYHGGYLQLLKPLNMGWYSEVHPVQ